MADPRFFAYAGPLSLGHVAQAASLELAPGVDPQRPMNGVATLAGAGPGDIAFLENRRYLDDLRATRAGACILHPGIRDQAPAGLDLLLSPEPYRAFARVAALFHPEHAASGVVDPRATVAADARLGAGVEIGSGAVIGAGATIGEGTTIGANSVIGPGVEIGRVCRIGPNVTISHALIGDAVRIFPGVRIGQDGFGYAMGPAGHLKVPQLGRVRIGDGVEIGANTTIDRGTLDDTVIGAGCVIDNLVQIAHNVRLGRCCVIVSQVGISGSTQLGDFVVVAGQAGLAGHLRVGSGAQIAAKSGVHRSIPAGESVGGFPAVPIREFRRMAGALRRLARSRSGAAEDERE
jgi:UDP-3-O-[3-hydroxymyristoyl] glucosamine N-acyltransferase